MTRPPTESFDDLPLKDLRRVMATLMAEVGRLRGEVGVLRDEALSKDDEIALLKAKIVEQADEIARLKNLLGLAKTCAKQGVSFYRFLGERFAVTGADPVPSLADLVRAAA
jgi:hypothetical protein